MLTSACVCTHDAMFLYLFLSLSLSVCEYRLWTSFADKYIVTVWYAHQYNTLTHSCVLRQYLYVCGGASLTPLYTRMCRVYDTQFVYLHSAFAPSLDARVSSLYSNYSVENMLVVHYACKPAWG